jgi:hypothetical protein
LLARKPGSVHDEKVDALDRWHSSLVIPALHQWAKVTDAHR